MTTIRRDDDQLPYRPEIACAIDGTAHLLCYPVMSRSLSIGYMVSE